MDLHTEDEQRIQEEKTSAMKVAVYGFTHFLSFLSTLLKIHQTLAVFMNKQEKIIQ